MPCKTIRKATNGKVRESMGNRANYGFRSGDDTIFLYGHWAGEPGMCERLATALSVASPRFGDDGYATRITISQLIGDDWNSETGWGLYVNEIPDNDVENAVLVVDWGFILQKGFESNPRHPSVQLYASPTDEPGHRINHFDYIEQMSERVKKGKSDIRWDLSEFIETYTTKLAATREELSA
jgi:hypothetical protein